LARAKVLYEAHGIAQKDLEQAIADQQNAEGALKAARDGVLVFGKTLAETDRMVADRKIDPVLVVPSPITGRITARVAQPGLFVQPGVAPAPYNVADLSVMWLVANVAESDSPSLRVGQNIKVSVMAFPGRLFEGKIARIGTSVDPNVHTVIARAEIEDPKHELRPNMIARFRVEIAAPQRSVALPVNGVVREGDGTMTAWVTTDRHRFNRKILKVGLQQGGFRQVVEGLQPGELTVTDGAVLLSNMAAGSPPTN
jgi:cobalt-zinc-cadmium efflux system membrane fusion protein